MSYKASDRNKQVVAAELKWVPEAWMEHMRKGEFSAAWKLSEKVLTSGQNHDTNLPRHFQSVWGGTPLHGKRVLVRCYHGLGDSIQFIRYAHLLKQIGAEVVVWAQPALLELFKTVPGIDHLFALHDGTPEVTYEVDCEVMELPFIFRSTLESIPRNVPYLQVNPHYLSSGQESAAGSELAVGLVWQAGDWNPSRCLPFSALEPLAKISGIQLYILQENPKSAGWIEGFGIYPGPYNLTDFAGVIAGLDLLITADSMPAHLAGALNVPVWTLLPEQADWRWMDERSDSPWYPSMRLFRQTEAGDWQPVVAQVTEALKQLVASVRQATS